MTTRNWTPEPWAASTLAEFAPHRILPVDAFGGVRSDGPIGDVWSDHNRARIIQCVNACEPFDDPAKEISALREALRASEAECAGWRAIAVDDLEAADANDATRARLGLKPIGEVQDAAEVDRRTAYWQSIVDGSERYRQDHARCMGKKNPAQAAAIQDQADRLTASFFEQYHDDLRNGRCKPVQWPAWLVGEVGK